MLDKLQHNDLVITDNKQMILDYLNENKKLLSIKIMNLNEFKKEYFGAYSKEALYYLIHKYHYKYSVAKCYLENIYFNQDLYQELLKEKLITINLLFKKAIKRIVVIEEQLDPYILKEIQKYDFLLLNLSDGKDIPLVYESATINDEVDFVCSKIKKMLDEDVDINKIYLTNITSEYEDIVKRTFDIAGIPININSSKNIYSTISCQTFIKKLEETLDINIALSSLPKNDIYNTIVDVCNNYMFKEIDNIIIYMIIEELKQKTISKPRLENAINTIELNNIYDSNAYYFILGFNQGICPLIYKDEDFYSDKQKIKLGILTSLDKNKYQKEKVKKIITSIPNIIITYKLRNTNKIYFKSSLLDELNLHVQKEQVKLYNCSHLANKIEYARMLDKFLKFNEKHPQLNYLYSNYSDVKYLTFDNKVNNIDKELLFKYLNNKLTLSYTSLDNFYHCNFRFFLANILKINKFEETFMTYIGTLYHDILSKAFKNNFNFEEEFNSFIKDREFSAKEEFFINKLKNNLLDVIRIIKKQDENSDFKDAMYEQKIDISKSKEIDITFTGIVDKIKYQNMNNKKQIAIIDYKTGMLHSDINNIAYGLSLQLPVYIYLVSKTFGSDIEIAGFYLQKIINDKLPFDAKKDFQIEQDKLYRLEGFSIDDINILSQFDNTYNNSKMIKSMQTTVNGFGYYSKVLSSNEMNKIIDIVDQKIDEAINQIIDGNFMINPKRINDKNIGCQYCKFKDICFKKEENIVDLEKVDYKEFLGGEDNA